MFKDTRESEKMKNGIAKAEALRPIAERLGCSLAQLALAWCMSNPHVSTCIGGATSVEQVKENLGSVDVIDLLTPEVLDEIEEILNNSPPQTKATLMTTKLRCQNVRHLL